MKAFLRITLAAFAVVSFSSVVNAADSFSWEGDLEGWSVVGEFGDVVPKTVADGIPTAAVTDGSYAIEMINSNFGGTGLTFRGNGAYQEEGQWIDVVFSSLKANTTMEFDVYVPKSSVENYDWAGFYTNIEGDGMGTKPELYTDIRVAADDPIGKSFHISWEYASDPNFNPSLGWGQINMYVQGGNDPLTSISPVYIDNFFFSGAAVVQVPGDYNNDLTVDAADYTVWRDNVGQTEDGNVLSGNGNGGVVDQTDYLLWKANYGFVASSNATTVPEPTGCLIGLTALSLTSLAGRRK